MRLPAPARLDPVGRLRLPRRSTTLRVVLVAILLVTAAGVLYSGSGYGSGSRSSSGTVSGPGGVAGSSGPAAPGPAAAGPDGAGPDGPEAGPAIPEGMVGVPVPLGDPASLALLRPGYRIDLLAVPAGGDPVPLADGAPVLAVDHSATALLLALTPEQGRAVVSAAADTRFAVIVRG